MGFNIHIVNVDLEIDKVIDCPDDQTIFRRRTS
nr:ferredoxin [Saccharina japonica]